MSDTDSVKFCPKTLDLIDELLTKPVPKTAPPSDDKLTPDIQPLDVSNIRVPSASSEPVAVAPTNGPPPAAENSKCPRRQKKRQKIKKSSGKENQEQKSLNPDRQKTKADKDHKDRGGGKNEGSNQAGKEGQRGKEQKGKKEQERDSFTVTGLLCQISDKNVKDKWFLVKVLEWPLADKRLRCYFRHLSDHSVPLIVYKTKFHLGVRLGDGHGQRSSSEEVRVLWVTPLEYIKLKSSDVLNAFKLMPGDITHEEIVHKFYFAWRPFLTSLLSQAHEFDEEALAKVLTWILPSERGHRVTEDISHKSRFEEIIKLFSSRKSSFLLRLGQFGFEGRGKLIKEMIELVATTNNRLDSVCHLLLPYYEGDLKGLVHLIEKCCDGFDPSVFSLAAKDYRQLPLIPVMEELKGVISSKVSRVATDPTVQSLLKLESHLVPNRIDCPWDSPEQFLNVHFRLLREECFSSIRDLIARVRSEPHNNQLVHRDVKVVSFAVGEGSVVVKIRFKPHKTRANLMYGNLLCIDLDTCFSNPIWATVKSSEMKRNEISISIVGMGNDYIFDNFKSKMYDSSSSRVIVPALQRLIGCDSGVMVESFIYYNAFRPVLARLQNLRSSDFPFASEILLKSTEPQPSPINFNLGNDLRRLDESQKVAAEASLSSRFSLIQGPPGCGKTFIGSEIVKVMLKNKKKYKGPILIISYKNHALDSFLESCLKFTKSLTRIGGRSTSEIISKFDLHSQTEQMKGYCSRERFLRLQEIRAQLQGFATEVEYATEDCLNNFTPSALFRFLSREQGAIGKRQLHSLLARNFERIYGRVIKQNYECSPSDVAGAISDILRNSPGTAVKLLKYALKEWLSESESEKFLPKPRSSLFFDTYRPAKVCTNNNEEAETVEEDEKIEEEWEDVVAERFVGPESKLTFYDISNKKKKIYEALQRRMANLEPDGREQNVCKEEDVWRLTPEGRYVLLSHWLREWRKQMENNLSEALEEYNGFYEHMKSFEQERNVEFLGDRDLIACTITGCCLKMEVIARVAPSIVIVEEGAEILESQLIAALPSSVQHVVLLGDHQQLPPQVQHFRLKHQYNLGVSIFERLAKNGYPISQLRFHRRGPKLLCPLFSRFYQQEIIATKEDPKLPEALSSIGLMYWWSHQAPAQPSPNGTSFENEFEALMVVGAIHVLILLGGAEASRISVITGYLGQAKKIKQLLAQDEIEGVSVCTIDRYQGDENDFIFLSLTRSVNEKAEGQPSLGFLASENRACVALSRARVGLYVFGCSSLFQSHPTWTNVVEYFREKGKLGHELCFKFPTRELSFEHPNDFAMFFKKLKLENENMKIEIHNQLAEELPQLKPGIHNVTEEFREKMENLMNHSVLNKRDLGVGRDCDGEKYRGFKVIKVRRIFNKEAHLVYLHHRKIIERNKPPRLDFKVDSKADWMIPELTNNANELFLFHGTKPEIVEIIAESGFDERVANVGLYGAGIYFAENADKSDQYTTPSGPTQERFMFLARVTLGNPYKTTTNYSDRRPPPTNPKKPTKLYDSVIAVSSRKGAQHAKSERHQEFIVFDRYQCIPEFIIHYVRRQ